MNISIISFKWFATRIPSVESFGFHEDLDGSTDGSIPPTVDVVDDETAQTESEDRVFLLWKLMEVEDLLTVLCGKWEMFFKSVKCEYNVFSWSYFWYGEVQRVRRQDCDPRSRPNTAAAAQAILAAASDKRAAALQLLDVGTSGKNTDIVSFFPFILPVFPFHLCFISCHLTNSVMSFFSLAFWHFDLWHGHSWRLQAAAMPTIEVRTFLAEPDEISQVTSCDIVLAKVTSEDSEVEISSCETDIFGRLLWWDEPSATAMWFVPT